MSGLASTFALLDQIDSLIPDVADPSAQLALEGVLLILKRLSVEAMARDPGGTADTSGGVE